MPDIVNSGSITLADGTAGVNPPAGSYLDIGVEDHPAVSLDLEGAFTATLVIEAISEARPTGADWFTPLVLTAAGVVASATLTAAGRRLLSGAGLARVRLRCTAFTAGPITVTWRAGQGLLLSGGSVGLSTTLDAVNDAIDVPLHTVGLLATPTITSGAPYAAGNLVGGLLTLGSAVRVAAGGGRIEAVLVSDKAKQDAPLDVLFFGANPTATTFTDKAALAINATDLLSLVGGVRILDGHYLDASANSLAVQRDLGMRFRLLSGTTLYAALVTRGTPTYVSTTDLQLQVMVQQD